MCAFILSPLSLREGLASETRLYRGLQLNTTRRVCNARVMSRGASNIANAVPFFFMLRHPSPAPFILYRNTHAPRTGRARAHTRRTRRRTTTGLSIQSKLSPSLCILVFARCMRDSTAQEHAHARYAPQPNALGKNSIQFYVQLRPRFTL